jgi:hypothetical protein
VVQCVCDLAEGYFWLYIKQERLRYPAAASTWRPTRYMTVRPCGPRWRLPLETSTEHSAKSEGMIRPDPLERAGILSP